MIWLYMLLFNFQGGYTPLHNASLHNDTDIVSALLQGGADVNIRNNVSITQSWLIYLGTLQWSIS